MLCVGLFRRRFIRRRAAAADDESVFSGCARYVVELKKLFGMFLVNDKNGNIFVEEFVFGGVVE